MMLIIQKRVVLCETPHLMVGVNSPGLLVTGRLLE